MHPSLPVLVLCNPKSGRETGGDRAEKIVRGFESRGVPAVKRDTCPPDLGTRLRKNLLADATPERFRALVVVGGDGTFHWAVNDLWTVKDLGSLDLPMAFVGMGTINVLSGELGLPSAPEDVVQLVLAGRNVRVPLLEANGRRFVLFAEAGWLARVVADVNAWRCRKERHGQLEFVRFGLTGLVSSFGAPLAVRVVTADGEERSGRFANVLVTRARNYGGTLRLPLCETGSLPLESESFTFLGERLRTPAGHALYLAAGGVERMDRLPGSWLERCLAREVRIEGPAGAGVHLDAESEHESMRLPLCIRPAGAALRVLVP